MKSTVGTYLDKISAHAGLEGRITPHSIRRSGAVAMKLKGGYPIRQDLLADNDVGATHRTDQTAVKSCGGDCYL